MSPKVTEHSRDLVAACTAWRAGEPEIAKGILLDAFSEEAFFGLFGLYVSALELLEAEIDFDVEVFLRRIAAYWVTGE